MRSFVQKIWRSGLQRIVLRRGKKMNDEGCLYLLLLEQEVDALRSVLSEFDGDKMEYIEMIKANAMNEARMHLRKPQ